MQIENVLHISPQTIVQEIYVIFQTKNLFLYIAYCTIQIAAILKLDGQVGFIFILVQNRLEYHIVKCRTPCITVESYIVPALQTLLYFNPTKPGDVIIET